MVLLALRSLCSNKVEECQSARASKWLCKLDTELPRQIIQVAKDYT